MSKKTKSTTGPSKFSEPFIRQGADALTNAFNANQGNVQAQTDTTLGLLNPFLQQKIQNGDPAVNAARDFNIDVLSGKFLDQGNPFLQQVIDASNNDIRNQTAASLGLKGLTGGSSFADIISRNIANNTSNLRFQDFSRERASQDAAANRAGTLASAEFLPIQGLLATLQASQTPIDSAARFAGGLGGLLGGFQTQSTPLLNQLLGSAAQGASAAAFASERRVKRNIEQIGTLPDGLGVYNFRYLWDENEAPLRTGVMVDEVEKLRPWALGPVVDGIQTVDYSKLEAV